MYKLLKYSLYNILKTKFTLLYTLFLVLTTVAIYQVDSDLNKVSLSLLNIVLLVVPLITGVFSTVHFYNSYEFMELMLAQPISRSKVFLSQVLSVGISLSLAVLVGVGLPMIFYGSDASLSMLLTVGLVLTWVFTGLAFLAAVLTRDKAKAIGIALFFWIYFSLIYDGFVLYTIYSFSDYPVEKLTLGMILFNPVDLARLLMLMQLDISALMGYTGAFFEQFFGSMQGTFISALMLIFWIVWPVLGAKWVFRRKDI
jgi:Cu-processing system permease protein